MIGQQIIDRLRGIEVIEPVKEFVNEHRNAVLVVAAVVVIVFLYMLSEKITSQVVYIKMDITEPQLRDRHLHLREVEFYDRWGARIVPLGCELSSVHSGTQSSNCDAMQDRVLATYWHSKYTSAGPSTEGGSAHFAKFTLPNDRVLKTMNVTSRYNNTSRYGMAYIEYVVNGVQRTKYMSLDGELIKSGTPDEGNTYRYVF